MASSSIFGECALPTTVPPYAPFDTSQTCAAGGGVCNYNPLFLLFTASAFRCLCPSGTVPEYTTADDVVCRPVIGTQCRSDGDCNSRATDCLGISTGFPIYFEGTGSQSPFSADLATFLSPIVSFFCSFNDRLAVDTSRGYTCEGGSTTSVGVCNQTSELPGQASINFAGAVLPQLLQRDLWRSLLFLTVSFNFDTDLACTSSQAGSTCQLDNLFCSGSYVSGLCFGAANRKCCVPGAGDNSCTSEGGTCKYDTEPCSGFYTSGLCAGPTARRCCIPSPSPDIACTSSQAGSTCQLDNLFCSGSYVSGLCFGAANRDCCVPGAGDSACISQEGTCKYDSAPCSGFYTTGLCAGPTPRRCCNSSPYPDIACNNFQAGSTCQTDSLFCSGSYLNGNCVGATDRRCCVPGAGDDACTSEGGTCKFDTEPCSGFYTSGLCAGPTARRCCIPSPSPDIACITNQAGSTCQLDNLFCSGSYVSGLCFGAANRRCCVPGAGDNACIGQGGTCKYNTAPCNGSYSTGLCAGPGPRRCCLP